MHTVLTVSFIFGALFEFILGNHKIELKPLWCGFLGGIGVLWNFH